MSIDISRARRLFEQRFGGTPDFAARAPGRVNIIGEHTDYNHGFVLPMAIERETVIVARRRDDGRLIARAANLGREADVNLAKPLKRSPGEPWVDYIVGVAHELAQAERPLVGADLLIIGNVPIASGLSSSASLEMAALVMFETLGRFRIEGAEAPRLGQRVENRFLGLNTGIMDQFIVRMAKADHALFLDCRSFEYKLIPVAFDNACFVVADTGVSRGLTGSKYNERVAECGQAVRVLQKATGVSGDRLRDFTLDDLENCRAHASEEELPDTVYRRARHVMSEDQRTRAACDALERGDAVQLGRLMNASDFSLRDDYQVTCAELDAMTDIARSLPGCYGSRMTGAGFGGCTVSLVAADQAESFGRALLDAYHRRTGRQGSVIATRPAAGAGFVV
ncbi:MAG: galactokinase [Trueperaceae bacterium]|nr:galactokinase [Trueperaceae bacterium]